MEKENWIHSENASHWHKQAIKEVEKRNTWERGKQKEIIKHPELRNTVILKFH